MPLQVGGNEAFAASVTYSVAPNASFARGEVRYVEDGSGAWDTASADALVGNAYDRAETIDYTGWNQSAGSTVAITLDLGSARTAPRLIAQGYYGTSSIFRPTAALLEWSDDNSAWTTVDNFTGLTGASGVAGARGWLVDWDTTGETHQYWRLTFTHGGTWLFISRIIFGTDHQSIGRVVTASPSPNAGIPFVGWDLLATGDSDWTDNVFNQHSAGARSIMDESFSNPQNAGWSQSAGDTVELTLDQGSALAGDRLSLKGYHGDSSIFRPTAVLIEYSDDNSAWTTHENKTSLTGGGTPGPSYWWVVSDISGETHQYWRATLTHGGQWLVVSAFEVGSVWINLALGRPYTLSTAADVNFADNRPTQVIGPGDSDWVTGGGKLTNGERAIPRTFGTGVGWSLGSGGTASARVDLGAAVEGSHFVVHGINGSSSAMVTPVAVAFAHSDDDSNWTTFLTISGLTANTNAKGRWAARADVSAEGSHQYWRATVTNTTSTLFITLSQLEFWQEGGSAPIQVTVNQSVEVEIGNPITPLISREVAVNPAVEVELGDEITPQLARRVTFNRAVEAEFGQEITPLIVRTIDVGQAIEVELGQGISPLINRAVTVNRAAEQELGNQIVPFKPIFVDVLRALEQELGRDITPRVAVPGSIGDVVCGSLAPLASCGSAAPSAICSSVGPLAICRIE